MDKFIVAGLGNPGDKYSNTRHNIGFMVLDHLAETHRLDFSDSKWNALIAKFSISNSQVFLVKPETFMNESGRAIGGIAGYYRIDSSKIIVIHDDLDLDLGKIKIVVDRGAGGHNGISSIISHLGSKQFIRIRVGIGRPLPQMPVSNFVLSKFTALEKELIDDQITIIANHIEQIIKDGLVKTMNSANRKTGKGQ